MQPAVLLNSASLLREPKKKHSYLSELEALDSELISIACKEGNLDRIKSLLSKYSPKLWSNAVNKVCRSSTPLLMACRYGHTAVVKFLVKQCGANVNDIGSVSFDGEMIEGAPPLWSASAAGHYDVVVYLVSHGAEVNATTFSNSTPLRAACFDGHYHIAHYLLNHGADIELANKHGHTSLMIACYKGHLDIVQLLIKYKANVNRKSVKGNTALHDCAESNNLEILQLLLENGAVMEPDAYGMSPILAAAVTGHEEIVNYLIDKMEVSFVEAVRALELLGATFIDKNRNFLGAYVIWTRALTLRLSWNVPVSNSGSCDFNEAYQNAREVTSYQQLDELFADPDAVRMQALLLRERVLGQAHPDTTYYIRYRGATYADSGRFDECLKLWRYALDIQQNLQQPLNSLTLNTLVSFTEIFSMMANESAMESVDQDEIIENRFPAYQDLMGVIEKVTKEIKTATIYRYDKDYPIEFEKILRIATHLICVLSKFLPNKSEKEQFEARKKLFQLVSVKPVDSRGCTLLHIACDIGSNITHRYVSSVFPSVALIELLCELGASASAVDNFGNTPLHMAAISGKYLEDIAPLLVESGAHWDQANHNGDTFVYLLDRHHEEDDYTDLLMKLRRDNVKLTCLCARVIQQYSIPYRTAPMVLKKFVGTHYICE